MQIEFLDCLLGAVHQRRPKQGRGGIRILDTTTICIEIYTGQSGKKWTEEERGGGGGSIIFKISDTLY